MRNNIFLGIALLGFASLTSVARAEEKSDFSTGFQFPLDEHAANLINEGHFADAELYIKEAQLCNDPVLFGWLKLKQGMAEEGINLLKGHIFQRDEQDIRECEAFVLVLSEASPKLAVEYGEKYLEHPTADPSRMRLALAKALVKQGDLVKAGATLDEVLKSGYSGAGLDDAVMDVALMEYQESKHKAALVHIDRLFELRPDTGIRPEYRVQWAHIARLCGREVEAITTFDWVQEKYPEVYSKLQGYIMLSRGLAFESMKNQVEAKREFDALIVLARSKPQFTAVASGAQAVMNGWTKSEVQAESDAALAALTAPKSNRHRKRTVSILVLVNTAVAIAIVAFAVLTIKRRSK